MKFSMRESQILDLLQRGLTNKEIGQDLGISPHTVRDHLSNIMLRCGLSRRAALVAFHTRVTGTDQDGSEAPTFVGLHL